MKHVFAFFALLVCTTLSAQASFGLLAGFNRSQEKYDVEVPDDARLHIPSYHVSGLLTVPLSGRLALSAEAGFIQRGAACMPGFVGFEQDSELRLHYGQLATSATYDLIRWRRLTLSPYAGVSGSYLFSGNTSIEDAWNGGFFRRELDFENDGRWNRTDIGATFGAYVRYRIGCGDLVGRVGGYRGFRNVDSGNGSLSRDLLLSVGYAQKF